MGEAGGLSFVGHWAVGAARGFEVVLCDAGVRGAGSGAGGSGACRAASARAPQLLLLLSPAWCRRRCAPAAVPYPLGVALSSEIGGGSAGEVNGEVGGGGGTCGGGSLRSRAARLPSEQLPRTPRPSMDETYQRSAAGTGNGACVL